MLQEVAQKSGEAGWWHGRWSWFGSTPATATGGSGRCCGARGWQVNRRRVHRLWRKRGLKVPWKQRKKRRLGSAAAGCNHSPRPRAGQAGPGPGQDPGRPQGRGVRRGTQPLRRCAGGRRGRVALPEAPDPPGSNVASGMGIRAGRHICAAAAIGSRPGS
jgi:hypothetical protein